MRQLFLFTSFCVIFASLASSQSASAEVSQSESNVIDFHIQGVRFGSPYSELIKRVGRPLKRKVQNYGGGNDCFSKYGSFSQLTYNGLLVGLIAGDGKGPLVIGFEVTSRAWTIKGARIGQAIATVERKLGKPAKIEKSTSNKVTYYYRSYDLERNVREAEFEFKDGRLKAIRLAPDIC